jgi:prepilin-type N-terminal cleavage/methylation domain-containing protein
MGLKISNEIAKGADPKNREEDKKEMRKQKGFSLIELLIVVAIILIIAAIAIPNLLRAKISANESSAVGSIRNIITAETSYAASYNEYGFALTLDLLGPGAGNLTCPAAGPDPTKGACLLDSALAGSANSFKSGYNFEAVADPASKQPADANGISAYTSFTASAVPGTFNQSGVSAFCAGEDGVLRKNPNVAAAAGQGLGIDFTPWATNCTVNPWNILQ